MVLQKRIGMILDATFPPDPRVENEAVSLIEAGHEVFLFCLHYGEESPEEEINGIQVKRYLSSQWEYKMSALVYTIPFYTYSIAQKIKHFINKNAIDVLHVHDIQVAAAVFKVNKNIPVFLDLHENRPEIMKFYGHLQKAPGKYLIQPKVWKRKEELFCVKADKVIVVTQEAKEELLSRTGVAPKKVVVLPNTVRTSFYENIKLQETIVERYKTNFVLLYIGDTALRRGLQTAINAVVLLKKTIPNIKLVVVGKSKTDVLLKQSVKELGLDEQVDFEGWQQANLFPSYITASDVCISPLHKNQHHDTTYANKIFQYMSLAKPLLVSNVTAQQNIIDKVGCGCVHQERDVDDFVSKVLILAKDKNLRLQMGTRGANFVKQEFSWEKISKKLINAYQ